ncbi:MAG: hypothetical protein AB8G18_03740 [Gammaproteobacteria bacterium]
MSKQTPRSSVFKKPLMQFCIGFIVYVVCVVAAFYATSVLLADSGSWRPYVASLPGVVLLGIFPLLYAYFRHYDEQVRRDTILSLAVSGVVGLSLHVVSMSRAAIGGYSQFEGASIVVGMALAFIVVAFVLSLRRH